VGEAAELLGGPGASPQGRAAGVRSLVRGLQRRFTAGERRDEALDVAARLHRDGMGTTLDVLGEQVTSEPEADRYLQAFVDLLRDGARAMRGWEASPRVDRSAYGPRARLNVSIKLSSLYSRFDPIDQEGSFEGVAPRLRALLRAARENGAAVRVDVEHYAVKGLTLDIFRRVLTEEEFRDWPNVGITIQTYLPENRRDFEKLAAWAEARGTPVGVRIVKGAYWDHEVQHARYRNWPLPVYQSKEQTDADFEAACLFVLEHSDCLRPAVASHNVRSVALAIAATQALGLPPDLVEFQTLYGLGDELKAVLVEMGLRMRVYVPFGELVPGTAYLVRRLLEATSRSAFLRQMWPATLPVDELIRAPSPPARRPAIPPSQDLDSPFRNEPVTDFSTAAAREQMARALEDVRRRLGRTYALRIDGKDVSGEDYLISVNPGMTSEVVGRVAAATPSQADVAVEAASRAFPAWAATPACDRAALLLRVADGVCQARFELAAWEAMEVGKSWREADADVAEAVDYLRFYAREAVRLDEPRRRDVHGEDNVYVYRPRGVAVAITPWNFPLGRGGGRQCRDHEARRAIQRRSGALHGPLAGGRRAAGRRPVPSRQGAASRRASGAPSGRARYRLHRLSGGRTAHLEGGGGGRAGARQARHCRDGRQECHHRGRRRGPGSGGARRPGIRLRLPGAEVFGVLAGRGAPGRLPTLHGTPGGSHPQPAAWTRMGPPLRRGPARR
jgi:RHH-type proline utilization regulon transcriptional repressor/proline dehydrogenase/delta 1-pyrroline-5-carboxylate dehydrogenase